MSIRMFTPDLSPHFILLTPPLSNHGFETRQVKSRLPTRYRPHIHLFNAMLVPPLNHPQLILHDSGGEEVLLDVGGQDATEAFEDVGHSDEAREILDGLLVGPLKRVAGDPAPKSAGSDKIAAGPGKSGDTSSGILLYAVLVVGAVVAYVAYGYVQNQDSK